IMQLEIVDSRYALSEKAGRRTTQNCSARRHLGVAFFKICKFINTKISNEVFSNKYNQS
ncbi:hypothetical protein HMPREF1577_00374, partial [Gardnerella pickettii JCP8017A]